MGFHNLFSYTSFKISTFLSLLLLFLFFSQSVPYGYNLYSCDLISLSHLSNGIVSEHLVLDIMANLMLPLWVSSGSDQSTDNTPAFE